MATLPRNLPSSLGVVNVASVPQRSPFRYPGGKTWLIPWMRLWLRSLETRPKVFVEPFAGGASIGLTVAVERLAEMVTLGELDPAVASVWRVILQGDAEWLVKEILSFDLTRDNVIARLNQAAPNDRERAFQTILRNRTQRGGILAPGASLVRDGENGKGVASRWYPQTLAKRIREIVAHRQRIQFAQVDASELIAQFSRRSSATFFVDPPYTAGGKRAGNRLYAHHQIDHRKLFEVMSRVKGPALLTYDDAPEVRQLAEEFGFHVNAVPMKNSHHAVVFELLISNRAIDLSKALDGELSASGVSEVDEAPLFTSLRDSF